MKNYIFFGAMGLLLLLSASAVLAVSQQIADGLLFWTGDHLTYKDGRWFKDANHPDGADPSEVCLKTCYYYGGWYNNQWTNDSGHSRPRMPECTCNNDKRSDSQGE